MISCNLILTIPLIVQLDEFWQESLNFLVSWDLKIAYLSLRCPRSQGQGNILKIETKTSPLWGGGNQGNTDRCVDHTGQSRTGQSGQLRGCVRLTVQAGKRIYI